MDAILGDWIPLTRLSPWLDPAGMTSLIDERLNKLDTDNIMTNRTTVDGLQIAASLHAFIEHEALPGSGIEAVEFWRGFAAIVRDLSPRNAALLAERARLQAALDAWYAAHPGPIADVAAYRAFLREIGYLGVAPVNVAVTTANPAVGGTGIQRALRAQRRERALGQFVRCALRHRRNRRRRRRRTR